MREQIESLIKKAFHDGSFQFNQDPNAFKEWLEESEEEIKALEKLKEEEAKKIWDAAFKYANDYKNDYPDFKTFYKNLNNGTKDK